MSKVAPSASADEAELERLDDEALAKLVSERANQPTIPVSVEDLAGTVGWVRPEAVTRQQETVGYAALTHPTDWPFERLRKVCKTTSGGTPSRKNPEYFNGAVPWVKSGELPDGPVVEIEESISEEALRQSSAKLIPAGTLLIALYGATVGKLGILTKPAATNQAVCAIFPFPVLDTKFLFWFLRFKRSDLVAQAVGGAQPNISQGIVRDLEVPIPPLDQQKRIVAEIEKQFSRLDEAVANLKRVKANLKRYKAAVLKAAVEGRLVETEAERARREGRSFETGAQLLQRILETRRTQWQGKGKYKEPTAPDTTNLPELPEGWVWASLGSLGDVIGGLTKNPKRATLEKKLPYLRVANVYANELRLGEIEEIGVDDKELEKLLVHKGDLLVVEGNGSPDQIGRLAIWDGSISPCVHQNHLIKVRLHQECAPQWVMGWLMSPDGRDRVRDRASSTSGLYTLSVGKVSDLPIPLPPVDEQHRIVAEIDCLLSISGEAEAVVGANLKRAQALRQAVLAKTFS